MKMSLKEKNRQLLTSSPQSGLSSSASKWLNDNMFLQLHDSHK